MDIKEELENADEGLQIGPLIDVVFLLLIYFIVTSTLRSPEADLGISLPGSIAQSTALNMPDEQIIEIGSEGAVNLNNFLFEDDGNRHLPELVEMLTRYKRASEAANNMAMVTIQADNATSHQRVIDVMNACAAAGIKHVTVGMGE
ncbi:MAG: biopolymer transporter ExbD [Verrucomicrobia bacterium]|nr:biopolymer transporter ExbD [Verrucomicrobiota bacterium]MCH8513765.1 biopolymer transporter ExbD [Kiritimatiellia bacterium]